jgi:hypothetical protein
MVHCKHGSGRSVARRGLGGPASPDASCEGEALAISLTVIPQRPNLHTERGAAGARARSTWMGPTVDVARSLALAGLAAFAILVLLPAVVAAQASIHI